MFYWSLAGGPDECSKFIIFILSSYLNSFNPLNSLALFFKKILLRDDFYWSIIVFNTTGAGGSLRSCQLS